MNLRSLCFTAALAAATLPAHAIVTTQWDFEAAVAPSAGTTWTGIASSAGPVAGTASIVHASASSAYSTPAGNGSPKSISSTAWTVGDYYQFSFGTTGYSGLTVSFDQAGSGTGPRDFTFSYSTNGTTFTDFKSYALGTGSFASGTVSSSFTYTMDLTAVAALNNLPTVTVRMTDATAVSIGGGVVAAGGTDRVDNFIVTATPVPEPTTCALLLAGLGAVGFMSRRQRS